MAKLTVLGIGNILMRDEGIGVRVLERVRDARHWPGDVEFVDGGAGGLSLLNVIEAAERMVVFDAAEMGLAAGESRVITPAQLADDTAAGRVSLHDVPFVETLQLCEQFSRRPDEITILAIQPKDLDYGRELSDELAAVLDAVIATGVELVCRALGQPGQDGRAGP